MEATTAPASQPPPPAQSTTPPEGEGGDTRGHQCSTRDTCRKLVTPANLRVLAFFLMVGLTIFLTTTVLAKPIERGSLWLRREGVGGYFVLSAIGFVFMMLGGSSHIFDFSCGFIYGNRKGLAVSLLVKTIAALSAYAISRTYFQAYLRHHFFNQYLWLEAFEMMVQEKPWQSMVLIRFSVLPAAVKNYGCGALGSPLLPFFLCAVVSFAIFSYLLTNIGNQLTDPKDLLTQKELGGPVEVVGVVCVVLFIGASIYYSRQYMKKLVQRHQEEAGRGGGGGGMAEGLEGGSSKVAPEETMQKKYLELESGRGDVRGAE